MTKREGKERRDRRTKKGRGGGFKDFTAKMCNIHIKRKKGGYKKVVTT